MARQTMLTWVLLLLLFLLLSPPRGLSHPLGNSDLPLERPRIQELLDRLRGIVPELQADLATLKPQQLTHSPVKVRRSRETASVALWEQHNPKRMHNSKCFGQRIDRIGMFSKLGCNVLRKT